MSIYSAKILIFLLFILGIVLFAAVFGLVFIRKNTTLAETQSKKKKKTRKKKHEEDTYNDNSGKFSEIENTSSHQRQSQNKKYSYTQTLTNLLDIEEDEASEDFTTSLLSERELSENKTYSEIVFESASLASTGEVLEHNTEDNSINELEERTQLLEDIELMEEEPEGGTSLLFDDEDAEVIPAIEEIALEKSPDPVPETSQEEEKVAQNVPIEPAGPLEQETPKAAPAQQTADSKTISIVDGNTFVGKRLDNIEFDDLANPIFINCKLNKCSFSEKTLENAKYINTEIMNCSFLGTEMPGALFDNVLAKKCNFKFASLTGASILHSIMDDSGFEKCDLDDSTIENTQFIKCRYDNKTSFNNAVLKKVDIESKDVPDLSKVGHII